MPLVFDREMPGARLAIWRVDEDEAQLVALVLPEDVRAVEGYGRAGRRLEGLAWRAAMRRIMPRAKLGYNAVGAPVVESSSNPWRYISVAHSGHYAVVLLSEKPCGVDIESLDRDFSRAAGRFIAPQEAALAGTQETKTAVWCAKEVMYKLSGREGLDLSDDLRITALDLAEGRATGAIRGATEARTQAGPKAVAETAAEVQIAFFIFDNYLVAWSAGVKNLDNSK